MRYFITPNYCVPLNAKCGSSSLCRRIIATYYPDTEQKLQNAHYPAGFDADKIQPHQFLPETHRPDRPVAMLVREPLDRFLSGVAYLNIDLDAAIDSLINGTATTASKGNGRNRSIRVKNNIHFSPQSEMPYGETHLFRFPDHIQEMADLIGIGSVPHLNATPVSKPTPSEEQRAAILAHYSADVSLYESITHPGVVMFTPVPADPIVVPETPEPVPSSITATQIRLWLVRNGISMAQVSEAIAAIADPQARAEAEVLWEYAPYVERTNPLVAAIAAGFNMDDAAIDQAFREAAQL
jgi:hypothetical protein